MGMERAQEKKMKHNVESRMWKIARGGVKAVRKIPQALDMSLTAII